MCFTRGVYGTIQMSIGQKKKIQLDDCDSQDPFSPPPHISIWYIVVLLKKNKNNKRGAKSKALFLDVSAHRVLCASPSFFSVKVQEYKKLALITSTKDNKKGKPRNYKVLLPLLPPHGSCARILSMTCTTESGSSGMLAAAMTKPTNGGEGRPGRLVNSG